MEINMRYIINTTFMKISKVAVFFFKQKYIPFIRDIKFIFEGKRLDELAAPCYSIKTNHREASSSARRDLWPKGLNYVRNYSSVEFMRRGRDLAGISSDINCHDKKRSRPRGSPASCLEQLCVTIVCVRRFTDSAPRGIVTSTTAFLTQGLNRVLTLSRSTSSKSLKVNFSRLRWTVESLISWKFEKFGTLNINPFRNLKL